MRGDVTRYELPQLGALNFVLEGALGGGVTRSLALDAHGKSLSSALLSMEIPERGCGDDGVRRVRRALRARVAALLLAGAREASARIVRIEIVWRGRRSTDAGSAPSARTRRSSGGRMARWTRAIGATR